MSSDLHGKSVSYKKKVFLQCFIFIWVFLVYSNSLSGSFHYDDGHLIVDNYYIRTLSNIPSFFVNPKMFSMNPRYSMYRPVLLVTYALNYAVHGYNVVGYHIVNVLLHAINSIIVFLILCYLFEYRYIMSFLAALLYATHPINTEAVNYISSRSDVLSTTFFLLSFYLFIRYRYLTSSLSKGVDFGKRYNRGNGVYLVCYFISLLSYFLGLLTKEVVITLPIILFLYDWFFNRGRIVDDVGEKMSSSLLSNYAHLIKAHLPFWVITACYLYIRRLVTGSSGVMSAVHRTKAITLSGYEASYTTIYQLTQIKVFLQYLKLWFFPRGLTVEHAYPLIESFNDVWLWFSLVILMVLLGMSIILYKKDRRITFFSLWFIVTLLPTSLLPLNVVMAEKRVYLAGIGIVGVLMVVFTGLSRKFFETDRMRSGIVRFTLVSIIALFSITTYLRNYVWRDDMSLFKDAIKKVPHYYNNTTLNNTGIQRIYDALGVAYYNRGEIDNAIQAFDAAIDAYPGSLQSYYNLGVAYYDKGDMKRAIEAFKSAIAINPRDPEPYNRMGIAYYKIGDIDKAVETFKTAIERNPRDPEPYNNLGNVYYKMGRYQSAIEMYRKAIQLRPEFSRAYSNLGSVYFVLKNYKKARYYYQRAIEIDPDNTSAIRNLRRLSLMESRGR